MTDPNARTLCIEIDADEHGEHGELSDAWPDYLWSLVADATPDDDLYFLAATCRRIFAAITGVGRRRLRTSWRTCATSLSRLAWASTPAIRPDVFRWSLDEDIYVAAASQGAADVVGALRLPFGTDPNVYLAALVAAIGGGAPHEIRDPLCEGLWQEFRRELNWQPGIFDSVEVSPRASSHEAAAAAYVALVAAVVAGGAALAARFARLYLCEAEARTEDADGDRMVRLLGALDRLPFGVKPPEYNATVTRIRRRVMSGWSGENPLARVLRAAARSGRFAEFDAIAPWAVYAHAPTIWSIVAQRGFAVATEAIAAAMRLPRPDGSKSAPDGLVNLADGVQTALLYEAAVRGQLIVRPRDMLDIGDVVRHNADIRQHVETITSFTRRYAFDIFSIDASSVRKACVPALTQAVRDAASRGSDACLIYRELVGTELSRHLRRTAFTAAISADQLDVCRAIFAQDGGVALIDATVLKISRSAPRIRAWAAAQVAHQPPDDSDEPQPTWGKETAESTKWGVQTYGASRWFAVKSADSLVVNQITYGASDEALVDLWAQLGLDGLDANDAGYGIGVALRTGRLELCEWLRSVCRVPIVEPRAPNWTHESALASIIRGAFEASGVEREWVTRIMGGGDSRNVLDADGEKLLARYQDMVDEALVRGRPAAVDWFRRRYGLSRNQLTVGRHQRYYRWFGFSELTSQAIIRRAERYLDLIYRE